MSRREPPVELTIEQRAKIAARLAVHRDRSRSELLAPFGLTVEAWDDTSADWAKKLSDEIRERAGSTVPLEDRYPLSSAYARAYSDALRDARAELSRDERDEDATVRLPPSARHDPLSLVGASNRAASSR